MHVPASAVTLARSLLSLSRSHTTGVLSVRSDTALCRLAFDRGTLHAARSNRPQPSLSEHVCAVFRWLRHDLRFVEGPAELGTDWVPNPPPTEALVLDGMRAAVSSQFGGAREQVLPRAELTAWGRSLLELGATTDGERSLLAALQPGAAGSALVAAAQSCELAYRTLGALHAFGALSAQPRVRYTLLLRKRAELKRRANAHELLDLEPGAHVHKDAPRRALRRLALHLHPDQFGPDAPESARVLSTEVMRALTKAAASLS
jgi:Domain of unknown function (DUF4388)